MQLDVTKTWNRGLQIMTGTIWVAGLLLAGSEGSHMPWGNILGLVLFWGASILMAKQVVPSQGKRFCDQGEQPRHRGFKTGGSRVPERPGTACDALTLGMAVGMVNRDGFRV
ncbi:MAG: hypothetical protein V1793_00710 [Pseudomonadota bacterium]